MKQNTMLMIGGAIVVYLLWKKSQRTEESNFGGGIKYSGVTCSDPSNPSKVSQCEKECPQGWIYRSPCHLRSTRR